MNPEKIGRYTIEGEIGRGGMATVYRAYDPRFERQVAVKVLPREFLHEAEFRVRFEREAKTIAMLEHPAIVPVYDFGEEDGQPYLVMRYMPGGSLTDKLTKRSLPIEETAEILQRIGDALERAHGQGIIHRDLKPSNILFDQYDDAFLADFGIVRIISSDSALTASGSLVGTPTYMSPEQVYGDKEIDGRADIYALGIILFQMLTGQTPYEADTPAKVMMKHVMDPIPAILDLRPDLPSATSEIISKAMAKERDARFASASDLTKAINTLSSKQADKLEEELAAMRTQIAPEINEALSEATAVDPDVSQPQQKDTPAQPPQTSPTEVLPADADKPGIAVPDLGQSAPARPTYSTGTIPSATNDSPDSNIPVWIWAILGGLLALCVAGAGIAYWIVTRPDEPGFNTAVSTITTDDITATAGAVNPSPNATGTALAEGRFITATAVAAASMATTTPESDATAAQPTPDSNTSSDSDPLATREAAVATRRAAEAEAGVATAEAPVDPGQAQLAPLLGPQDGALAHEPDDNTIESEFADVSLANFATQVTFITPYSDQVSSWDFGVFFRQQAADNEMRLVIRSDGTWNLNNRQGSEDNFIQEGSIPFKLNNDEGEANILELITIDDKGYFLLNGQFVSQLDLSSRTEAGDLAISTGFYVASEQAGATTRYESFTLWELDAIYGPSSGTMDHIDDNLIKTRNSSVNLINFLAQAAFLAPYSEETGTWDFGFSFRDEDVGEQFWLVVESTGFWALYDRVNSEDVLITEGELSDLNLAPEAANSITLLALDGRGFFLLNGVFVASLDLTSRLNAGDVQIFTAYFVGNEIPGNATGYDNFTVWSLP